MPPQDALARAGEIFHSRPIGAPVLMPAR